MPNWFLLLAASISLGIWYFFEKLTANQKMIRYIVLMGCIVGSIWNFIIDPKATLTVLGISALLLFLFGFIGSFYKIFKTEHLIAYVKCLAITGHRWNYMPNGYRCCVKCTTLETWDWVE